MCARRLLRKVNCCVRFLARTAAYCRWLDGYALEIQIILRLKLPGSIGGESLETLAFGEGPMLWKMDWIKIGILIMAIPFFAPQWLERFVQQACILLLVLGTTIAMTLFAWPLI